MSNSICQAFSLNLHILVFQFNISLKVNPPEILCFSHSRDSYLVSMCSPVLKAFLKSAKVCTFPLVVQIAPCFNKQDNPSGMLLVREGFWSMLEGAPPYS